MLFAVPKIPKRSCSLGMLIMIVQMVLEICLTQQRNQGHEKQEGR